MRRQDSTRKGCSMIQVNLEKLINGITKLRISKPNKKYTEDEVRESISKLMAMGFLESSAEGGSGGQAGQAAACSEKS